VVDPGEGMDKMLTVGLDTHVENIQQMKDVTFRVNPNL
jgi:hypothetical protein